MTDTLAEDSILENSVDIAVQDATRDMGTTPLSVAFTQHSKIDLVKHLEAVVLKYNRKGMEML